MSIKEAISKLKKKERDSKIPQDIKDFVLDMMTEFIANLPNFLKGDKGDKGDTGEQGKKGQDGLNGKDGINGKNGFNGKDGQDGKNGIDGKDGQNGKDGSPDTPEKIADKVNTLEEKIEQKTIKGLKKTIENLYNLIKEVKLQKREVHSGGGIGNTQHETYPVSSATTSITTRYKISGNGFAIWAYYQGQMIVRGTHYTVGGDKKTLSLTFTPTDNTFIDLIYIR